MPQVPKVGDVVVFAHDSEGMWAKNRLANEVVAHLKHTRTARLNDG